MNSFPEISKKITSFLSDSNKPLITVMGPTASGKSSLAVKLAKQFDGEVINADSRQVYEEMKIGNELTKPEEMEGIPHHLFSYVPLKQTLSVADYKADAERTIEEIQSRGKLPIICGGSVLWIDAVVDNYQIPAGEPDMEYRAQLELKSVEDLLSELREVDPDSAVQFQETKNKRYIMRALEVFHMTGQKKSELAKKGERKYQVFKVAPHWDREVIYERINARTHVQVDNGMIPEVQALVDKYADGEPKKLLELGWPSLTSIGCKEVVPLLAGEINKEDLIARLQQNNRNYAKRQLTWLRKYGEIRWLEAESE
jgi:tRNA dimethylallyltransferase